MKTILHIFFEEWVILRLGPIENAGYASEYLNQCGTATLNKNTGTCLPTKVKEL
jgi:hypothetical protein